jgi:hypothetical protein
MGNGPLRAQVSLSQRYLDLVEGRIDIEDLDNEELLKGRLKDKDGMFRGRPPKFLPTKLLDAMRKEYYNRVNATLEESLPEVVKVMRGVALDRRADPATRLRAAIYIYERYHGKIPDKVIVHDGDKVDDIVDDILYDLGESPIEQEIAATEEELLKQPRTRTRKPATRTQRNR